DCGPRGPHVRDAHVALHLRHTPTGSGSLGDRPRQHEFGLKYGFGPLDDAVESCCHPGNAECLTWRWTSATRRPAERVVAFYNKRGTCEQWIKEGKGAIKWTRLSCRTFAANAVRLQLHALAYNLGNFLRTLATPEPIKDWSLTSLKEKLIKIGAKVVSHGRYVIFQMAEVAIARQMFQEILRLIAELRSQPPPAPA